MNIRAYREKLDLTQDQLSRLIGVSTATISMWENRISFPKAKYKDRMMRLFQVREWGGNEQ